MDDDLELHQHQKQQFRHGKRCYEFCAAGSGTTPGPSVYPHVPYYRRHQKYLCDKVNDSRYDGTFTTVYRGNWQKGPAPVSAVSTLYNANFLPVTPGSAILTFLNDEPAAPVTYPAAGTLGNSNVGAGILSGRADWVVSPNGISRLIYPGLWKMGTYRTDNGTGLGYPNAGLTRPFNIAKFSELFFVAAEAAVRGATTTAVPEHTPTTEPPED